MSTDLPVFRLSHTFNAPIALVWQAWTDPQMLSQWFGPKGGTCTILKQELKPGGVQHACIAMPEITMYGKFVYREVEPLKKLVWEHSFSDEGGVNLTRHPFSPDWPLQLLTTVIFTAKGEQTEVALTWTPLNASEKEIAVFASALDGMEQGWGGSYENLDALLAKKAA